MRVATYNRKSVYSDHSDSVSNQERMCREHARLRFGDKMESFEAYQDEGFTGANTDRPGLKRLLADVEAGKIDALVVYQLDRLSRSVKDFADIWDRLEKKGTLFVSIKENIDTETPMGRAMTYITMVFAQMERETIAERVTDNARGLAMKGYWLGGKPPAGYRVDTVEAGGKKHKMLVPDEEGAEFVKMIFRDFLETGKASSALARMYDREGVKGLDGKRLGQSQIYEVLKRPLYCEATEEVYDYFVRSGCHITGAGKESWDGKHGVMVYGKTKPKGTRTPPAPREDWIVSLGAHEPLISAKDWLTVQKRISDNVFTKFGTKPPTLLKGVVRCALCGRLLSVRRSQWGIYYCCAARVEVTGSCQLGYIKAEILDDALMGKLRKAVVDQSVMDGLYAPHAGADAYRKEAETLNKRIAATGRKLENLAGALAEAGESAARRYIIEEIGKADAEKCRLSAEKAELERKAREAEGQELTMERDRFTIENLVSRYEEMDAWEKNRVVRDLVERCTWDGETLHVYMSD